jgi:hypothetical protein
MISTWSIFPVIVTGILLVLTQGVHPVRSFKGPLHLLIIGASAVIQQASRRGAPKGSWLAQMLARKPKMLVTVALGNKMARIIWALLVKGGTYRTPAAAA